MCAVSCHCKFACGCMYEDYKSVNVFHFNRICTYTCINGVRAGGGDVAGVCKCTSWCGNSADG